MAVREQSLAGVNSMNGVSVNSLDTCAISAVIPIRSGCWSIAGSGSTQSRQASSCEAIGETLRRAGLGDERDVRPSSVAAWAGARVFAESGRIEVAAVALGIRSLDRAARLIGHDWRQPAGSVG